MHYISFRAIVVLILSILFSIWFGKLFIRFMKHRGYYEQQRDAEVDPYNTQKKGVPTMGGLVVIASILLPCLLFGKLANVYFVLMVVTTVLLGSVGFADDYISRWLSDSS